LHFIAKDMGGLTKFQNCGRFAVSEWNGLSDVAHQLNSDSVKTLSAVGRFARDWMPPCFVLWSCIQCTVMKFSCLPPACVSRHRNTRTRFRIPQSQVRQPLGHVCFSLFRSYPSNLAKSSLNDNMIAAMLTSSANANATRFLYGIYSQFTTCFLLPLAFSWSSVVFASLVALQCKFRVSWCIGCSCCFLDILYSRTVSEMKCQLVENYQLAHLKIQLFVLSTHSHHSYIIISEFSV